MGLSDHMRTLHVSGGLSSGFLPFEFALEWQGFLELLGDVEPVEMPLDSHHRLRDKLKTFVFGWSSSTD